MFYLFSTPAIYMSVTRLTHIFNDLTLQGIYSFAEDWTEDLMLLYHIFIIIHPHYSFTRRLG